MRLGKMWNDKKRKKCMAMMENSGSAEDIFQRRRQRWMQYGRALLTIGALGLLTIALYSMTHTAVSAEASSRIVNDEEARDDIAISNNEEKFSEKIIIKRAVAAFDGTVDNDKIPKNNLNDVESDNELDMDSQHLKIFRRQQSSSNNVHRHSQQSDNGVYVFKGYKCVPIRKPTKQLEYLRARQRAGMCVCLCF